MRGIINWVLIVLSWLDTSEEISGLTRDDWEIDPCNVRSRDKRANAIDHVIWEESYTSEKH